MMRFRARLLYVYSEKNDPNNQVFQRERIRQSNIEGVNDKKIEIIYEERDGPFKVVLKDYEGEVLLTLNKFDYDSFPTIFATVDEAKKQSTTLMRQGTNLPDPTFNKIGGNRSTYYHKYMKYKMKYLGLRSRNKW